MKQCDFSMRITLLHMRPLYHEHHGTTACNNADPCATLRAGVRGIYLTAPLDAQAWSEVQTGVSYKRTGCEFSVGQKLLASAKAGGNSAIRKQSRQKNVADSMGSCPCTLRLITT